MLLIQSLVVVAYLIVGLWLESRANAHRKDSHKSPSQSVLLDENFVRPEGRTAWRIANRFWAYGALVVLVVLWLLHPG